MSLAISPDGKKIACADNFGVIRLWNVNDGQLVLEFKAHDASMQGLAFSPDGKKLVSASHDSRVKVWTIETSEETSRWLSDDRFLKILN